MILKKRQKQIEVNKIYNEDCLDTMKRMPDNFVDLVVTSPPYDNLRDYKGYSFNFELIAKELYRILKQGGIVVWVVCDAVVDGSETGTSFRQALFFKEVGFKLYDTMIYQKNSSAFPPIKRYEQVVEFMFILSKGNPKTVNLIKDKKNRWAGMKGFGKQSHRKKDGSLKKENYERKTSAFGIRSNIWRYSTGKGQSAEENIAFKHPAIFPEKLANDHIITWTNKGDLVYDPMMGSGTTAKMSIINYRNYIGSEISKEYCDIINKRINRIIQQKKSSFNLLNKEII